MCNNINYRKFRNSSKEVGCRAITVVSQKHSLSRVCRLKAMSHSSWNGNRRK